MSKERMPYVGETVLFTPNPGDEVARSNYNKGEIAAIVTRVWSHGCVNIKIIPDCGAMQDRTSVVHQTLNSAGYSFRFLDEPKIPKKEQDGQVEEGRPPYDAADASTFLKDSKGQGNS